MDVLLPLYILSIISSIMSAILALFAIQFSRRTEERLKRNFTRIQKYMKIQHDKTEGLLASIESESEEIKAKVHETRMELLESIENVHKIRDEILESVESLEDSCINNNDKK
ncbi:MAG: hypothetical protein HZC47_02140 [Methanobacterium sp.]|uniref:hypothetical protein n=1 Tax=Methanobacterium sp. TaxID=2164 RepID=UPI003D65EEA1|nr:hypothetical protein [Methanobacterium sp.]